MNNTSNAEGGDPIMQVNATVLQQDLIVKCFYVKNLNMSPAKLAAQVAHAVTRLMLPKPPNVIRVLMASRNKFNEIAASLDKSGTPYYIQKDLGLTEVSFGTETTLAYIEPPSEQKEALP